MAECFFKRMNQKPPHVDFKCKMNETQKRLQRFLHYADCLIQRQHFPDREHLLP